MPTPHSSFGQTFISKHSLQAALRAFEKAESIDRPLNTFITILWERTADFSDGQLGHRYEIFTRRLREWLTGASIDLFYMRVFERSAAKGLHSHTLAHLPSNRHRDELIGCGPKMIRGFAPNRCVFDCGQTFLETYNQRRGVMRYMLKTYDPEIRIQRNGGRQTVEAAYGIRHTLNKQNWGPIPCQLLRWSHTLGPSFQDGSD
jgi:hypothetical protein